MLQHSYRIRTSGIKYVQAVSAFAEHRTRPKMYYDSIKHSNVESGWQRDAPILITRKLSPYFFSQGNDLTCRPWITKANIDIHFRYSL